MLGNSRQKLCALPIGKRQQGCMRRTDDKIQIAVPQSCVSFGDGKQEVDAGVETFRFKEAKLDGSDGGKIRIRDKIGNGDSYHRQRTTHLHDLTAGGLNIPASL